MHGLSYQISLINSQALWTLLPCCHQGLERGGRYYLILNIICTCFCDPTVFSILSWFGIPPYIWCYKHVPLPTKIVLWYPIRLNIQSKTVSFVIVWYIVYICVNQFNENINIFPVTSVNPCDASQPHMHHKKTYTVRKKICPCTSTFNVYQIHVTLTHPLVTNISFTCVRAFPTIHKSYAIHRWLVKLHIMDFLVIRYPQIDPKIE
jgi:hypothetical protein